MNIPPEPLPNANAFLSQLTAISPIWFAVTWAIAAGGPISMSSLFEANTLVLTGLMNAFYAAGLLAWDSLHGRKVSKKLRECTAYDIHLDSLLSVPREPKNAVENALRLEQIGKNRKQNHLVRQGTEENESAKYSFALIGFLLLGVSTMFQVAGTLEAKQSASTASQPTTEGPKELLREMRNDAGNQLSVNPSNKSGP